MDKFKKFFRESQDLEYGVKGVKYLAYFAVLVVVTIFLARFISTILTDAGGEMKFNEKTGPIGDTIGGTLGPFIAIIAAILTYKAFKIQYDANIQQQKDLSKERFENKFFEMLRLHKECLNELCIKGYERSTTVNKTFDPTSGAIVQESVTVVPSEIRGRDVFEAFYRELLGCYKICKEVLHFEKFDDPETKKDYLIKASYKLCFSGINNNHLTEIDPKFPDDAKYLQNMKVNLSNARIQQLNSAGEDYTYNFPGGNIKIQLPGTFKLFGGHVDRLGHYYRQLFAMVKFVANQDQKSISYEDKREYLRMLRGQLSRHEQLMLYFNYVSGFGAVWENGKNHFFSDYRMIHNLPMELAMFASDPRTVFASEIARVDLTKERMFEYDE